MSENNTKPSWFGISVPYAKKRAVGRSKVEACCPGCGRWLPDNYTRNGYAIHAESCAELHRRYP